MFLHNIVTKKIDFIIQGREFKGKARRARSENSVIIQSIIS